MASLFKSVLDLFKQLGWAGTLALSAGLFAVSIVLAAIIVLRWPPDQFKGPTPPPFLERRHPVVRTLGLVLKNALGYVILVLGFVMALPGVPGQGFLLILIGVSLLNFPGKRRLERRLIRRPAIRRVVNALRQRFGQPPLEIEDEAPALADPQT